MPNPSRRVRNKKFHQTRFSGGRTISDYGSGKTSVSRSSTFGQALSGVPRLDSTKIGKNTGTQRRIERIYSGNLCHSCLPSPLSPTARNH